MPRLWAGFKTSQLPSVTVDGPELEAAAQRSGANPTELLHGDRRDYEGLALVPLGWTSHCWRQMTTVFADLHGFPQSQTLPLRQLPDDLPSGFPERRPARLSQQPLPTRRF